MVGGGVILQSFTAQAYPRGGGRTNRGPSVGRDSTRFTQWADGTSRSLTGAGRGVMGGGCREERYVMKQVLFDLSRVDVSPTVIQLNLDSRSMSTLLSHLKPDLGSASKLS